MGLVSPTDQQHLREQFAKMTRSVHLLFFTQTLDCEACLPARQILDELPPLSELISIEEVNFVLDADKAKQYGIDRVPAIAMTTPGENGAVVDTRIRFVGLPSGYEFITLVEGVLIAGGRPSTLTPENRARI